MNKKGFTLVELLAVLVIIGIITGIATGSFSKIIDGIHEKMLETKIKSIKEGAIIWGQENRNTLIGCNEVTNLNCDNVLNTSCVKDINYLLSNNYLSSKEECKNSNGTTSYICMKNNVTGESLNDEKVYIYFKDNQIFATMCNSNLN
jgi:prepilin-type N-terminal cleavage/methylation domain-containing protein